MLGKGRYLTQWLSIYLTYDSSPLNASPSPLSEREYGQIINQIQMAALKITLTGPAQLFISKRILAFDFTRINVSIGTFNLYSGEIRGGKETETDFYGNQVNKQAFFAYFLVKDNLIAARGKGGGLALWGKIEDC